jgi:hypothetical protein
MNGPKIDDAFFNDIGMGDLSREQKEDLQIKLLETLQMRIGLKLSEDLTDDQLAELESKFVASPEDTPQQAVEKQQVIATWLEQNHPNYKEVVATEFEKLKQDMKNPDSASATLAS